MSEQVPQSFGAITATNALAGNYFYGGNNITFNGGISEGCRTKKSKRALLMHDRSKSECLA